MPTKKVLRVSPGSDKIIRDFANTKGILVGDAADHLISVAARRLGALSRYADRQTHGVTAPKVKAPKPPPVDDPGPALDP